MRTLLLTGPGGAGTSTLAAAAAVRFARDGLRTVLLSRQAAAAASVDVPAPPGPVRRSVRTATQPSTRFLSSLRAVSRMTFSALRFIIPSRGILVSIVIA